MLLLARLQCSGAVWVLLVWATLVLSLRPPPFVAYAWGVLSVLAMALGVFAVWKVQHLPVAGYEHRTPEEVKSLADPACPPPPPPPPPRPPLLLRSQLEPC